MINSKGQEKIGRPNQAGLWEDIIADPGPALKASMNDAIKTCSLSREQIVEEMNRMARVAGITCNGRNQKVTTSLLDKWVALGATPYYIPIRLLPIFCRAVGNNLPMQVYTTFFIGMKLVSDEDYKKFKWAEAELGARAKRRLASRLAQEVGL